MYVAAIFSRIKEYVVGLPSPVLFSGRWLVILPETTGSKQCSTRKHLAQNITCSNLIKFRIILEASEVDFHFTQATQWLRNGFILPFMVDTSGSQPTRQRSSACRRCFMFSPTVVLSPPPITHWVEPHLVVVVQIQLTDWDKLAIFMGIPLPSVSVSDSVVVQGECPFWSPSADCMTTARRSPISFTEHVRVCRHNTDETSRCDPWYHILLTELPKNTHGAIVLERKLCDVLDALAFRD